MTNEEIRKLNPDFLFNSRVPEYAQAMKQVVELQGITEQVRRQIVRMIGVYQFHAETDEDRVTNVGYAQNNCPTGWTATYQTPGETLPPDAIVVGSMDGWGGRGQRWIYIRPDRPDQQASGHEAPAAV